MHGEASSRLRVLQLAQMIDAAGYYEAQQRNLERRFLASVQDAINWIALNPDF
jgi:hypothetical protein